jgi:hypothetical protein
MEKLVRLEIDNDVQSVRAPTIAPAIEEMFFPRNPKDLSGALSGKSIWPGLPPNRRSDPADPLS